MATAEPSDVLLVGNPNSGKSLLFSRLTGLKQKVANYPGVTVEVRSGSALGLTLLDFPGIYSLEPLTGDERVAIARLENALESPATHGIVCVLDATRLERSLYLLLELVARARAASVPLLAAVNIIDEVVSRGAQVDVPGLERALGCQVVAVSAKTGEGLDRLRTVLDGWHGRVAPHPPALASSPSSVEDRRALATQLARAHGPSADVLLRSQERLDRLFLSPWLGIPLFALVMTVLFQAIFTWAAPVMALVRQAVEVSGAWTSAWLPEGVTRDFVRDGLFAGVGSFLVFVPQIFILFVVIGLLEDSGYLARAAIILHRPLGWFGLSGRSFLPLLSGHACAIPAMMAARTIESPRRRLLTVLVIPFMSCSARLPIYALIIGGFVPAHTVLWGAVGLQGLAFTGIYAFGIVAALLSSAVLARATRGRAGALADAPFVVELPPYRVPGVRPILVAAASRSSSFVRRAAPVIFCVVVAVWMLGYFPKGAGHLAESWLASTGRWIEPVFRPLGADWTTAVAILTSFVAREVFVGTLGTLHGLEDAGQHPSALSTQLQASGMGVPAALALLVFYALSLQCASTLAVMRKETGSGRIPVFAFLGMTGLAYTGAVVTYQLARVLGA
jgi:ferrous iron transport protein B